MDHLKLTVDKLSVDEVSELVTDESCGAVSMFIGTTRDSFEGKKVLRLEYEAYEPMALKALKSICEDIRGKWPAVHSIAIYHRLGMVPSREASVVIAVSSPHRRDSLDAVAHCIDQLKASVPIWKKEVYETADAVWKENVECAQEVRPRLDPKPTPPVDKNQVQILVSSEELQQRAQNFTERKRAHVNVSNIHDFIPGGVASDVEDSETCARVRTQLVRRSDSKGHVKVRRVHNEWGPQTMSPSAFLRLDTEKPPNTQGLPDAIAERVVAIEKFLNIGPVSKDIYKRLKQMEEKISYLEAVSPEYAHFWKTTRDGDDSEKDKLVDYTYSADDIDRKIALLEKGAM